MYSARGSVEDGIEKLAGRSKENIVSEAKRLLDEAGVYSEMAGAKNPYGDDNAKERIFEILCDNL